MGRNSLEERIKEDFITGDDGYKVFWPEGPNGAFSSWLLRKIADMLDEENAEWHQKVLDKSE